MLEKKKPRGVLLKVGYGKVKKGTVEFMYREEQGENALGEER